MGERGGCGGATFFALDRSQTSMLLIQAPQLFDAQRAPGGPTRVRIELPSDEVSVSYQTGRHLKGYVCDDAPNQAPQVEESFFPEAGMLEFEFVLDADNRDESSGSVTASDLVLVSSSAGRVALDDIEITDVRVAAMEG